MANLAVTASMMSRVVGLETYDPEVSMTAHYVSKLEELFDYLANKTVIDFKTYSELIELIPTDLSCKLRLVPDDKLASRLSHLYAIYSTVISMSPVAGVNNYSVVSIEGSNTNFPFDCDLIIYDHETKAVVMIDYTSSSNTDIIRKKMGVIMSNIALHKLQNCRPHVELFNPIPVNVNIKSSMVSTEPGTLGLKLTDHICNMSHVAREEFFQNCARIYETVNDRISSIEETDKPGDYKDYKYSERLTQKALELVSGQHDRESFKLLRDAKSEIETRNPYYDGLIELVRNSQNLIPLIPIEGASTFEQKDLITNLANLSDDWLCKLLHAASLTENVVSITDTDELKFDTDFPPITTEGNLPTLSQFKASCKLKKGHVFRIHFNPTYAEENLRRLLKQSDISIKDKNWINSHTDASEDFMQTYLDECLDSLRLETSYFTTPTLEQPKDTIWKKIWTISSLASNDLENIGRSASSLLESFLNVVSNSYLGSCMSHAYEVNKTILASLKVSPGSNEYYVGVNGSYASVTLVKMCSTLDSFSKTNYSVMFKPERSNGGKLTRLNYESTDTVYRTKFYSIDPNILSYNIRIPYIYLSFATWELENNLKGGLVTNGVVQQTLMDAAYLVHINRDQFAQAAEQVRYFYMSSIGYGGSAADIVSKTTFLRVRHAWEFIYLMRSFKLGCSLSIISSQGFMSHIPTSDTGELLVAFPHTHFPSKSFSQTISSMYVCNIYNKFRAFHEVSEAICYNGIMEETKIYRDRISEDIYAVAGVSPITFDWAKSNGAGLTNYLCSQEFYDNEVSFCLRLSNVKSKRYCGSLAYIMGATYSTVDVSSSILDSIYSKLNQSPIEACTMRGSMDIGDSGEKGQGIRAASAVLEALFRLHDKDPKSVNNSKLGSVFLFDAVERTLKPFTLFSLVQTQFCKGVDPYRYRIVQKDQKGHREISVLNFVFRIGALFVETIARELSQAAGDIDVVHNPNKDKIVEDAIQETFKRENSRRGTYCYDNSDQKRWGPNHNMNFFASMLVVMLRTEPGLARMVIKVFDQVFDKRAKFPESLIKLALDKGVDRSNSQPIQEFLNNFLGKMNDKVFEMLIAQGMCQGIFHDTSSLFHAIKSKARNSIMGSVYPEVSINSFTTSDDAEDIYYIPKDHSRTHVIQVAHCKTLRVGNLFNIVRSNPKSAFNFHIAELNSIFYKKGEMATPSLKQRIAKIDVGSGLNHIEDYLSALSNAANYLSSGGSYMGATIMSILNLTLHTEQWLRWDYVKSDFYYRPVEMGGFPVIEPISTIISGGSSNMFLRASAVLNAEAYARLTANTLLCPPEEVALSDFARSGSDRVKKAYKDGDVTIFRGAGPLGAYQMVRTDRKLSQFERRHGISNWDIPESFITLKRAPSLAKDFLFSIYRTTSVHTLDSSLGVNSFFIRFAEPWVAYKRPCMKISDNSPFKQVFNTDSLMISHEQLSDCFKSYSFVESAAELNMAYRRCVRHPEFVVFESQLAVRLQDSLSLFNYLRTQEAESFRKPKTRPTIQNVTLRGYSASDSDTYHLSMIKSLSGKKARHLINSSLRSTLGYESIEASEPINPLPLSMSIILADNAISLYEKFIRRSTKMTLPTNVDTLRDLCLEIFRNKFTEQMGVAVDGSLDLVAERTRPHAYSNWYQELLKLSEKYETDAANAILSHRRVPDATVGISSKLAVLSSGDMFALDQLGAPTKTVKVDSQNKDNFVNTIKLWLPANIKYVLSHHTIKALIAGKLSFAHDYYIGDDRFIRYAKNKYFRSKIRGNSGTHIIEVVRKWNGASRRYVTQYRHIFVFSENINGGKIQLSYSGNTQEEEWANNLKNKLESAGPLKEDVWYEIPTSDSYRNGRPAYRRTIEEHDVALVTHVSAGMEFEKMINDDSLCYGLKRGGLKLPVSYLNPDSIESMDVGFELTDEDLKIATRHYVNLRNRTHGFDRAALRMDVEARDALDFIITGSTTSTPNHIVDKRLSKILAKGITPSQLDIIRTQLVLNPKIGINYSAGRFTQSLLNLGKRRKHDHSFFSRRIAGDRVEYDSEDWDAESEEEEYVHSGPSDTRELRDFIPSEEPVIPEYLKTEFDEEATSAKTELTAVEPSITWADEVIQSMEPDQSYSIEATTREEIYMGFSDESEDETEEGLTHELESNADLFAGAVQNVTLASNPPSPSASPVVNLADMANDLLAGMDFNAMFNPEADEDDAGQMIEEISKDHMDTLEDIFKRAMGTSYGNIVDEKDSGLKSEVTGHTVNPGLENARTMIRFLKNWLNTAGKVRSQDYVEDSVRDITGIVGVYVMLCDMKLLQFANPIEQLCDAKSVSLPANLSSLAVISSMYL